MSKTTPHLIIQPFDSDYEFLEALGNEATLLYETKIKSYKVHAMKKLPDSVFLDPSNSLDSQFIKTAIKQEKTKRLYKSGEKMIFINDLWEEMTNIWAYNSKEIFLAILPHFIFGFEDSPHGTSLEVNMSIVSTHGMKIDYLSQICIGVSLHEIGHNLGLQHCNDKICLMRYPPSTKDFYRGVYKLCKTHLNELC